MIFYQYYLDKKQRLKVGVLSSDNDSRLEFEVFDGSEREWEARMQSLGAVRACSIGKPIFSHFKSLSFYAYLVMYSLGANLCYEVVSGLFTRGDGVKLFSRCGLAVSDLNGWRTPPMMDMDKAVFKGKLQFSTRIRLMASVSSYYKPLDTILTYDYGLPSCNGSVSFSTNKARFTAQADMNIQAQPIPLWVNPVCVGYVHSEMRKWVL